jgi:DNA-binding NarL/FixJ family response regulator
MSGSLSALRIVIADEHPVFRDGLRRLLESDFGLQVVGESSVGPAAADLVRSLSADILLLGVPSPSERVRQTLLEIEASGASVRTILLAGSVSAADVADALQFGACGVVPKDASIDVLLESIVTVMGGLHWLGNQQVANAAAGLHKLTATRRRSKAFGLTERELDIVRALTEGRTNKEIAARFAIGERTVKRHLTRAFNKLGASNRLELAQFAAHHRVLDGI